MITGIWRAPVIEHPSEAAPGKMGPRHVLRYIGEAEPGERRIEHLEGAVEDELAFDMHLELAPVLFEFPSI